MKGLIFNVNRYSIHDGPGIRVTFFMKGCPLSCWWCHNPEGISANPQTIEVTEKVGEKEFTRLKTAGEEYSVVDILEILERERIFISESKGGVTFSGGEPLLQADFLREALTACKTEGFHTAVDTCGYAEEERVRSIIPFTDLFLYDLKHPDNESHVKYTGVSNDLIINNLKVIMNSGKDVIIRIPIVPGINDDPESLEKFKNIIIENKTDKLKKISLLPYHKTGASKYRRFNIPYRMEGVNQPSPGRMRDLQRYFFTDPGLQSGAQEPDSH